MSRQPNQADLERLAGGLQSNQLGTVSKVVFVLTLGARIHMRDVVSQHEVCDVMVRGVPAVV